MPVDAQAAGLPLWPRERLALLLQALCLLGRCGFGASAAVTRSPLLRLAIEEEVAQDPAWAPEEAVGPPLDAALVLVEDENGARGDHLALRIDETTGDAWNKTSAGGLEDEEGVAGRLDPS